MPQLSPMMGFVFMIFTLILFLTFLSGMVSHLFSVNKSKGKVNKDPSYTIFK
uniref:ATP synthase F0 subunit 8 n=1 Tax=Sakuraeolis japonica TaxID=1939669 RepID=A0A343AZH1_9GAST|nr:ATP synthase F0 subunit 8 [Sakuraeolis japonica]APZ75720.1 ATP synthase F0 subunit 8 [Sakuraeolis japonica]